MTSSTPLDYPTDNNESSFDDLGYALDFPLYGNLTRLTYEELHTLNVLVNNTIEILSNNSDSKDQVLQLENL